MEQQLTLLWQQLPSDLADWLKTAQHHIHEAQDSGLFDEYVKYSAMTKRKLGAQPITEHWRTDQLARLLLLKAMLQRGNVLTKSDNLKAAFKFGDEDEQIVIVKALDDLAELCELAALVELAQFTGRTNSSNLFAALALNNPFPAKHYNERAFHQLVLKTLFMDLDISQMLGLSERKNPNLSQLAMDLVNERLAADRQPPGGIWLAIVPEHLSESDRITYQGLAK